MSETETVRDSQGRDARIHGAVLDEGNPGPTLRELLRQWSEAGVTPGGDLAARTMMVLDAVGPDASTLPREDPRLARLRDLIDEWGTPPGVMLKKFIAEVRDIVGVASDE